MNVFPAFYFGSIEYFKKLIIAKDFLIEFNENFQKQTYRNRCHILGANGLQKLIVPVKHNGKRIVKDIEISYDFPWQKEHLKSVQTAYRCSPYFEYYEDEIIPFFEEKEKFLLDLNLKTLDFINSKLNLNLEFSSTQKYETLSSDVDYRNLFDAKSKEEFKQKEYLQVFGEKFRFVPNLSILDLLCNEGPNSINYLK